MHIGMFRHLVRIDGTRPVKKRQARSKQKGGKPSRRWMDDDDESNLRNLGVRRWRTTALDRIEYICQE
jgi:hypothetical protein